MANDIREHAGPLVIAHIAAGEASPIYHIMGSNVRVLVVDENAPNDRVYEVMARAHPRILDELLAGSVIGKPNDKSYGDQVLKVMADAPVPLPVAAKKRELPSYLRVIK